MELKANLNPEQRDHLELLKDKMKKILGGKTKQELAKAGDLEALRKYKNVLESILDFLKTKEIVLDVELRKQKQIKKVENIINSMGDAAEMTEEEKCKVERLSEQIKYIKTPEKDKYEDYSEIAEVELLPGTRFSIEQVAEVVAKVAKADIDDVFLIDCFTVNATSNDIVTMDFGVAGKINYIYKYHAANQDSPESVFNINTKEDYTVISEVVWDLETGDFCESKDIAEWSEGWKSWINKSDEVIKV